MKLLFLSLVAVLWLPGFSQQPQTVMKTDKTLEQKTLPNKWFLDLFEMGVEQKKDSLYIKDEVLRLVSDSAYRNSIYPEKYAWPYTLSLMKAMELKRAFWHLINIYMDDSSSRPRVLGIFVLYDSLVEMDKLMIHTYYTYAFTDPRVCRIENNKPEIYRPDLLEKHLLVTKEIINNIQYYRKKKTIAQK